MKRACTERSRSVVKKHNLIPTQTRTQIHKYPNPLIHIICDNLCNLWLKKISHSHFRARDNSNPFNQFTISHYPKQSVFFSKLKPMKRACTERSRSVVKNHPFCHVDAGNISYHKTINTSL